MSEEMKLFSKKLTQTDIKKRLAIPTKILGLLPDFQGSHTVRIRVMYDNMTSTITCSVRKTGYKKPVLEGDWRKFVVCNKFNVGDELTMYRGIDEEGVYCRVEVAPAPKEKVSETTGKRRTKKISNFELGQPQLPKEDALVKQEGAIKKNVADVSIPSAENFSAEQPSKVFGMGEQSLPACPKTKEERDIEAPVDLNEGGSLAEANSKSTGGRTSGLVQGQASPYDKVLNLDLTLAQPIDYTRFDGSKTGSLAALGTNQVTGEPDSKSTGRRCLDFVQGQPSSCGEAVNLDLTLA